MQSGDGNNDSVLLTCDGRRGPRKRSVLRMLLEDYLRCSGGLAKQATGRKLVVCALCTHRPGGASTCLCILNRARGEPTENSWLPVSETVKYGMAAIRVTEYTWTMITVPHFHGLWRRKTETLTVEITAYIIELFSSLPCWT
jgi:hypothetical protein